jgi:hypothetical protein
VPAKLTDPCLSTIRNTSPPLVGGAGRVTFTRRSFVVVIDQMTPGMGCDDDAVVGDVEQPVCRFDRDGFAGEVTTYVIAMLEDADATGSVDTTRDRLGTNPRLLLDRNITIDTLSEAGLASSKRLIGDTSPRD